ncbi:MAG: 3-oxoacyl-ACP synthase [Aurantibacter sp.]
MAKKSLKQALYRFCQHFIEERLCRIEENMASIQESLSAETKSSAGDKHETARAMLQLEREKLGQQLAEAESTRQSLAKVNIETRSYMVGLGSLVQTSKAHYFLSISASEFKDFEDSIFCISSGTPIAQLLLGKSKGDVVVFNGEHIEVLKIS